MKSLLKTVVHNADICVIGGGIGGMFTAISAARHGAKVVLMHDRPVLGGNASSEIRMWISGAGTRWKSASWASTFPSCRRTGWAWDWWAAWASRTT